MRDNTKPVTRNQVGLCAYSTCPDNAVINRVTKSGFRVDYCQIHSADANYYFDFEATNE